MIAACAITEIAPNTFNSKTAAFLYPVLDRYYAVTGGFLLST